MKTNNDSSSKKAVPDPRQWLDYLSFPRVEERSEQSEEQWEIGLVQFRFRKAQDLISQGMRKDRVGRAEILLDFQ